MPDVRVPVARALVPAVAIGLLLTGCSGSNEAAASAASGSAAAASSSVASGSAIPGIVTWKTAKDVNDALSANGFSCKEDGSVPEAFPGTDAEGKSTEAITFVLCDGYSVVLVSDADKAHAIEKAMCEKSTSEDWDNFEVTTGLTGGNFYVLSNKDDRSFPKGERPEDFQKVFGGVVETDAQYLERSYDCTRPAS